MNGKSSVLPIRIYVPVGSLGVGISPEDVEYSLKKNPHAMAMDAGSTDSGAAYLAKGVSKNNRRGVKADLELLMAAQKKAGIPILIGTAGQAGGDMNVDWTKDIVREIAREKGYSPKIACLYSEQSRETIKKKLAEGKILNLAPMGDLDDATIDSCLHIVGLMGPEPYFEALEAGADIIIGGRTSDPAVIGAFAMWNGAAPAFCWHAGKVAECGGQASTAGSGTRGLIFEVYEDHFLIEAANTDYKTTALAIAEHALYENKDPWKLTEPGGVLDLTECEYEQLSDTQVKVSGTAWRSKPYTMKLEGASGNQFQSVAFVGITDPDVLAEPKVFHDRMVHILTARALSATLAKEDEFGISVRMYGWNGVSGVEPSEGTPKPRELGVMLVVTASSQELASDIIKACNPYFFHMPIRDGMELPSYGMVFSPNDMDRGPVYQFELNHVVSVDDPMELVRMEISDLAEAKERENA
jgi:hypothetical protein